MENIKCSKVASPSGIDNFEHKETVKADTYTLTLIVEKLKQKLQAYKDKEDKLRELIEKDYADIKEDFNKGFAFGKEMDYVWWLRERFLKIIDGSDGE